VYNGKLLRKQGFSTKAQAEAHLMQAMQDIAAAERGEVRIKPTTMQDALGLFKRKQDVRAVEKSYAYGVHARATINRLQEFVDQFGPGRLVREVTAEDIRSAHRKFVGAPYYYIVTCPVHRPPFNSSGGTMVDQLSRFIRTHPSPFIFDWMIIKV
jgi:hypothetical protein